MATMFEDVRRERSLLLLLSVKYPDILKQTKLTEHDKKLIWNFAPKNYTDRWFQSNMLVHH